MTVRTRSPSASSAAIPLGVWHKIEIYVKYGAGTGACKVWMDGVLRADDSSINLPPPPNNIGWQELNFRNFRGGGGEVITNASQMRYGHIYLAGI